MPFTAQQKFIILAQYWTSITTKLLYPSRISSIFKELHCTLLPTDFY